MVEDSNAVRFHFPSRALEEFLEHVLGDLAADVGVSQLKSKDQRKEYLSTTPQPDQTTWTGEARALTDADAPSSKPSAAKPTKSKRKPTKPARPFNDLDLSKLGLKTQALLREFRSLDVDRLPNAAAVLTRAVLELSVEEFIDKRGLRAGQTLRKRVRACLDRVDPTKKANEYQSLRIGLADGTSLYSVNTLHGFVHNAYYHADGMTVRNIAANIEPFLQALNDLA